MHNHFLHGGIGAEEITLLPHTGMTMTHDKVEAFPLKSTSLEEMPFQISCSAILASLLKDKKVAIFLVIGWQWFSGIWFIHTHMDPTGGGHGTTIISITTITTTINFPVHCKRLVSYNQHCLATSDPL